MDILADSSKLQEENPGLRSAEGDSLSPCVVVIAVKLPWKLGNHCASTPRHDLSLPLPLTHSLFHSLFMGKKRETPLQTTCEEKDSSIQGEIEAEAEAKTNCSFSLDILEII